MLEQPNVLLGCSLGCDLGWGRALRLVEIQRRLGCWPSCSVWCFGAAVVSTSLQNGGVVRRKSRARAAGGWGLAAHSGKLGLPNKVYSCQRRQLESTKTLLGPLAQHLVPGF